MREGWPGRVRSQGILYRELPSRHPAPRRPPRRCREDSPILPTTALFPRGRNPDVQYERTFNPEMAAKWRFRDTGGVQAILCRYIPSRHPAPRHPPPSSIAETTREYFMVMKALSYPHGISESAEPPRTPGKSLNSAFTLQICV